MQKRIWLITLLLLSSCTVGPVYESPGVEFPCDWHEQIPDQVTKNDPGAVIWWENLQDPILNELMQTAACENLDLKIACLRVLQARTVAKAKKADLYPRLDGSATYDHIYFSKQAAVDTLQSMGAVVDPNNVNRNIDLYEIGFDAEWEIDLFGYTRHEIAALKAQAEAAEENLCDVWVTLSAEIAKNYIELRGFQQRRVILEHNLQNQKEIITLTQELVDRGVVNKTEYNQKKAEWNQMRSELSIIDYNISSAIHHISILLGKAPGELHCLLEPLGDLPQISSCISIGVPSDLLRRRPDIRSAERNLAAATEKIGSAIAALFPRFSLRGFVGDISTNSGALFNPASATWFAGPMVLVPIFNSRLLLQDVKYNKLATQEAFYTYQKTVLAALEESENAIVAFRLGGERLDFLTEAYEENETALAYASELFDRGVNNSFEVNQVEKAMLNAEDAMIQGRVGLLLNYVALYKALGGSWNCDL
jgi:NodT family efflux transporter outer membrane factor (OMF) lipoprotein